MLCNAQSLPVAAPRDLWTQSRHALQALITAEQHRGPVSAPAGSLKGGEDGEVSSTEPASVQQVTQSHESRLRQRLERLNLEMVQMAGDGNCQVRAFC